MRKISKREESVIKRKYLIIASIIAVLTGIAYILFPEKYLFVKSTNLKDDSLAGVCLMEQVDIQALEEKFGKLTNDNINKNELRGLEFDNYPYYAYVQIDKDNEVAWISVGYPNKSDNTKFVTSRGIGSESKFSDVLKAYGDNYAKKLIQILWVAVMDMMLHILIRSKRLRLNLSLMKVILIPTKRKNFFTILV